jgi:hypothetical protein
MSVSGTHVFECAGKQVSAQQHPDAFTFFDKFLTAYPVDRIIEIGTAAGGLAWWLRHRVSVPITTYDIVEHPLHADLRAARANGAGEGAGAGAGAGGGGAVQAVLACLVCCDPC